MDDLPVGDHFVIPESELRWSFTTSGGPGGQHANRTASQAELRWDFSASAAIDDELRNRLSTRLGSRARGGIVSVVATESRSQWQNRQRARRRLAELLEGAIREPPPRIATKPSKTARTSRVEGKRRLGEKKRLRRRPDLD